MRQPAGLRAEASIAELCRREGIAEGLDYSWSKEVREAGKRRLAGDTSREASSGEVSDLRHEMGALKEAVADLTVESRLLKNSLIADGYDPNEVSRIQVAGDDPPGRGLALAGQPHAGEAGRRSALEGADPVSMEKISRRRRFTP